MRRRKSTGRGLSLQRLLYDRRAQDAVGRAGAATRDVYRRARGESAREAVTDRKTPQLPSQSHGREDDGAGICRGVALAGSG